MLGLFERTKTVESREVGRLCVVSQRVGKRLALTQEMMGVLGENQRSAPFSNVEPASLTGLTSCQHKKAITAKRVRRLVRDSCQTGERQHRDLVISHGRFPTVTSSKGRTDVEIAVHVQAKTYRRSLRRLHTSKMFLEELTA